MQETRHASVASEVADHPIMRGLGSSFLAAISQHATAREFSTDEYLLHEGEEATDLYLVYSGKVAIEVTSPSRTRCTVETVGGGGVVGWSGAVAGRRREFDARALKQTRTISISSEALRAACEQDPANGYQFMVRLTAVVAERLASIRLQLVEASSG